MATNPYAAIAKMFSGTVQTLAEDDSVVIDARGTFFTVITDAGTATVSRVDAANASSHTTGSQNQDTVDAATRTTFSGLEWAYYRVTAVGGDLRYFSAE